MATFLERHGGHTFAAPGQGGLEDESGPHAVNFVQDIHEVSFSSGMQVTGLKLVQEDGDLRIEVQTVNP